MRASFIVIATCLLGATPESTPLEKRITTLRLQSEPVILLNTKLVKASSPAWLRVIQDCKEAIAAGDIQLMPFDPAQTPRLDETLGSRILPDSGLLLLFGGQVVQRSVVDGALDVLREFRSRGWVVRRSERLALLAKDRPEHASSRILLLKAGLNRLMLQVEGDSKADPQQIDEINRLMQELGAIPSRAWVLSDVFMTFCRSTLGGVYSKSPIADQFLFDAGGKALLSALESAIEGNPEDPILLGLWQELARLVRRPDATSMLARIHIAPSPAAHRFDPSPLLRPFADRKDWAAVRSLAEAIRDWVVSQPHLEAEARQFTLSRIVLLRTKAYFSMGHFKEGLNTLDQSWGELGQHWKAQTATLAKWEASIPEQDRKSFRDLVSRIPRSDASRAKTSYRIVGGGALRAALESRLKGYLPGELDLQYEPGAESCLSWTRRRSGESEESGSLTLEADVEAFAQRLRTEHPSVLLKLRDFVVKHPPCLDAARTLARILPITLETPHEELEYAELLKRGGWPLVKPARLNLNQELWERVATDVIKQHTQSLRTCPEDVTAWEGLEKWAASQFNAGGFDPVRFLQQEIQAVDYSELMRLLPVGIFLKHIQAYVQKGKWQELEADCAKRYGTYDPDASSCQTPEIKQLWNLSRSKR